MNKQKANGIEWTMPYGRNGYTWNPISGCHHACEWVMSDGQVAQCYAKTVAEKVARKAYPHGFNHHYFNEKRLSEPLKVKQPSGIFLDSMSDLMAWNVPSEQIEMVLDVCKEASQHIFFLLTKNPVRLKQFTFPKNVWVGASSPPDIYMGKVLTDKQKEAMLTTALKSLDAVNANTYGQDEIVTWMSFEPLSNDYSRIVSRYPFALRWAVIGAASNGRTLYPPVNWHFTNMLDILDHQQVPVFFKGNMKSLPEAVQDWRVEYPSKEPAGIM